MLVKFKIVDNTRFRFLHHAIYFFVMCGVIAATVIAFLQPSPQRLSGNNLAVNSVAYSLAVLTAMLLLMIRFRGRTAGHWMYALVCLSVYSVIVFTSI
ncbi:MAG: hypothetical protein IAF08_12405 [Rhizobacter sp.]|nr:hypothetical protein [Chlorobiales bacterium]